jgi:hypothetical protein
VRGDGGHDRFGGLGRWRIGLDVGRRRLGRRCLRLSGSVGAGLRGFGLGRVALGPGGRLELLGLVDIVAFAGCVLVPLVALVVLHRAFSLHSGRVRRTAS